MSLPAQDCPDWGSEPAALANGSGTTGVQAMRRGWRIGIPLASKNFRSPEGRFRIDTTAAQHDNARASRRVVPAGSQS